jgi:hypothetical protein
MTGIAGCCARAASGQAVANAPITLKKSRRRIAFLKALKTAPTIAYDDVITAGIGDRRNGVDGSICAAKTLSILIPLAFRLFQQNRP